MVSIGHNKFGATKKPVQITLLACLLPLAIFVTGCFVHYRHGSFGLGPKSLSALGVDDAYISYRYGWNLATYGILSWNETGYRRVEGFTNPLWVYLSAGWALLGNKSWVYPLMVLTSIGLAALFLVWLAHRILQDYPDQPAATIGLLLAAAVPATWLHATSGLESTVFGITLAALAYEAVFSIRTLPRSRLSIFWLTGLVCLLRSDGFIYAAMVVLAAMIAGRSSWKMLILSMVVFMVVLFSWRWLEFGALLPNTFLAKVNFSLLERLKVGSALLGSVMVISSLPIFLLLGLMGLRHTGRRSLLAGAWLMLAWLAYYLYIGGDYFLDRHLVGLFFLCGATSAPVWSGAKPKMGFFLGTVVLVSTLTVSVVVFNRFDYWIPKERDPWVMLGQAMQKDRPHFGVFVTSTAGKIPYYAGGDCIDIWGLNDPKLGLIRGERFFPGHSSGSQSAAIEVAQQHPAGFYTLFTRLDNNLTITPDKIDLWVDTRHPQEKVQVSVTFEEWQAAVATKDNQLWSIVTTPQYGPIESLPDSTGQ